MEISGILLKLYKGYIEKTIINTIAPYYYQTIKNKASTDSEILYCVCLFDDILEYCSLEVSITNILLHSKKSLLGFQSSRC